MFNKSSTGVMFVLALAGGLFFSAGPQLPANGSPGVEPPKHGKTQAGPSPSLPRHRAGGPCPVIRNFLDPQDEPDAEEVEGKLSFTGSLSGGVNYKLKSKQTSPSDDSCGEGKLTYIIALVSDPVNSHLSLAFDRTVESIQRAASAAQYQFSRSYFPWKPELVREETDLEKRTAQADEKRRLERYPGLLLFRSHCNQIHTRDQCNADRDLAVFLVSETPTYGVNGVEFSRALSYMGDRKDSVEKIDPWSAAVPIVGPNYSGSGPTLRLAMRSPAAKPEFKIFNGAATDQNLHDSLGVQSDSLFNFIHFDQVALKQFNESGFSGPTAILAEDETVFGNEETPNKRTIHFPRDISHFRNAVHPLPEPGASRTESAPLIRQLLPFDLRESEGKDSVPALSGQTASAQQAVLTSITRELNEGRYSYVGIRASDPLDVIFLSRLVREESPDARLFVLDADLLFVRSAADSPLVGMLSITTYPLLLRIQFGLGHDRVTPFSNRTAEATYNAAISAIASLKDSGTKTGSEEKAKILSNLSEYQPPTSDGGKRAPPLWITVLGHSGYWPVALIPADCQAPYFQLQGVARHPDRLWVVAFGMATLLALAYAGCSMWVNKQENIPRWLEGLWVNPSEEKWVGRCACLTARNLLILTLYIVLASSWLKVLLTYGELSDNRIAAGISAVVVLALLIAIPSPWVAVVNKNSNQNGGPLNSQSIVSGSTSLLAILIVAFWLLSLSPAQDSRDYFLAWRSINLSSGVSPALSIIFALLGIIWWTWANFRRLVLCHDRVPLLPNFNPGPVPSLNFFFSTLKGSIDTAASDPLLLWEWRLSSAALCLIAIAYDPFDIFRTVETVACGFVMRCAIGLLAGTTLLSLSRMGVLWFRLRQFLMHLERHPIRDAFTDLPRERMWSPIMQHGGLQRTYLLEFRALECVLKIKSLLTSAGWLPVTELLEQNLTGRLEQIANGERSTRDEAQVAYQQIRNLGEAIVQNVLLDEWKNGSSDTLAAIQEKGDTAKSRATFKKSLLPKACAEFVVLPYLFYIRTCLLQLQNLLFSVVAGYVLLVLAISCYPYRAQRTLAWGMTLSLIVLGVVVIVMLAQMSRDAVLSRITETTPGKLDGDFFLKLSAAGALPVLSLVASQFPAVSRFLFSWLQPTLQAIK